MPLTPALLPPIMGYYGYTPRNFNIDTQNEAIPIDIQSHLLRVGVLGMFLGSSHTFSQEVALDVYRYI